MNIINYIKLAGIFILSALAFSFGVTRTRNKELEKEKKRDDKTIDSVREAKKISEDIDRLDRNELAGKL
tara:strand:- start:121 stop:327 length:207 start_codon:yes stop_codon:yes gene_type:complete